MKSFLKEKAQVFLASAVLLFSMTAGAAFPAVSAYAAAEPGGSCTGDITGGIQGGINCAKPKDAKANLFTEGGIFQTVTNILLFLVGAISVIMLIIGGIRYVISGGDQAAVTSAKNTILYAIIGIVVAFLAFAAVSFVIAQLNKGTAGTGYNTSISRVV